MRARFVTAAFPFLLAFPAAAQNSAAWTRQPSQTSPPPRFSHSLAYESAHAQVVLFGGQSATNLLFADTWVWDGSNWTQKSPKNSPPARFSGAMAYDAVRGQVVLFGGNGGAPPLGRGYLNDTWVWDGSNWTQKFPQNSPPARFDHTMAFDTARGQMVLFGGTSTTLFADTWVWDGNNWQEETPQSSPAGRSLAAMTGDPAHGAVVLFGGNSNATLLNDTWLWDGSTWTRQSPAISPTAREGSAMAYDSANSEAILFGGGAYSFTAGTIVFSDAADTWAWDGASWTRQAPPAAPPARDSHAMAYDPARNFIVMFGGVSGAAPNSVVTGDTWTWNSGPRPGPVVSGVASASDFGGLPAAAPGSWIEIYGSHLSPVTRSWIAADFNGSTAPTSLDGVSVNIGGASAFVGYVSPNQVNVQLPSLASTTGSSPLTIANANGTSAPVNVSLGPAEPGLLAPASFQIGGNRYVTALLPDGSYVLPTGAVPGLSSRPARPGETIVLYGVGFGPVTPDVPAGQIAPAADQLTLPVQFLFGQTPATVQYDGLAPGLVGLYQFNVLVPPVPDSDLVPLTFTLNGAAGVQTLVTAVHR